MPMQNVYNPYLQNYFQPQAQQMLPTQMSGTPQIQNGGFVSVRNEDEARRYPVAPGNSVTFKDETAPYVYTKTMGFSQLDRPIFDKYRLVKEEPAEPSYSPDTEPVAPAVDTSTIDNLKSEIKAIWSEIEGIKNAGKRETDGGD